VNASYQRFAVAWLVSACIGCTSAPVRYYTLIPMPARTLPASETNIAIDVRVVRTPPQLNRAELMVRTSATEVMLLENERWASPVNDEIKSALRLELQHRLSGMTGLRPAFTKLTLDIDVQHFEAQLGRYAMLAASWSAIMSSVAPRPNDARITTCTFQAEQEIPAGYPGMVEGYQREIAALADAIVAVVAGSASGSDASCQKSIEGSAGGSGPKTD
jgi:uncharacterized lipoprotein YmbA